MSDRKILVLTGKPCCGKGTKTKQLREKFGWRHSSSGDEFRRLEKRDDNLGRQVKVAMASGRLLPDPFIDFFLVKALQGMLPDQVLILDGYARTLNQARRLHELLSFLSIPYLVINLVVTDSVALERLEKRSRKNKQRTDSNTDLNRRRRLQEYLDNALEIREYFRARGTLRMMFNEAPVEETFENVLKILKQSDYI